MVIKRLKSVPKGFRLVKAATTAPVGFRLFTDRKGSRFNKNKKKTKFVFVKKRSR